MRDKVYEKLDRDHRKRIDDIAHRFIKSDFKTFAISDIFLSKSVQISVQTPKVIIPSFNVTRILSNIPFSKEVYVLICPNCTCIRAPQTLTPFLESGTITPLLSGPYSAYPKAFVDRVLPYPHLSLHEFAFYRFAKITQEDDIKLVCSHCVEERRKELLSEIHTQNIPVEPLLDRLLSNLHPYLGADMELIETFKSGLLKKDSQLLFNSVDVSEAISDIRTMEAYDARFAVPKDLMAPLTAQACKTFEINLETEFEEINRALLDDLGLTIPKKVDIPQFLKIVEPYRPELTAIVDSLITDSIEKNQISRAKLSARLADLNHEITQLSRNKGLLSYRASAAFLKANRTVLATALIAGTIGFAGNLIGCGATIISGLGIEIAKRKTKIKLPKEVKDLGENIAHSLRPSIHRLLAKYLNLSISAVQLWEIKQEIHNSTSG